MPKSFGNKEGIQVSVVLSPRLLSFVRERAEKVGSQADALREAIESHFTLFGLPEVIADRLRQDLKEQDKDLVTYVRDLLGRRYTELMEHKAPKK
jgi:hypothetical protein